MLAFLRSVVFIFGRTDVNSMAATGLTVGWILYLTAFVVGWILSAITHLTVEAIKQKVTEC